MSLQEFCALVRHFLKWIIVVPVVVMLGAALFGALRGNEYVAESALTITDTTGALSSEGIFNLVSSATEEQSARLEQQDVDIELARRAGTDTAVFTVTSDSEEQALTEAKVAAEDAAAEVRQLLADQAIAYRDSVGQDAFEADSGYSGGALPAVSAVDRVAALESCVVVVSEPHILEMDEGNKAVKFGAIGLVGGVIIVLAVCVCAYLARRPIVSSKQIEGLTEAPVIDTRSPEPSNPIGQLWINAYLGFKRSAGETVFLIPVSSISEELKTAMIESDVFDGLNIEKSEVDVVSCSSIESMPQVLIEMQEKGQAILVVKIWVDSVDRVVAALEELKRGDIPLCSIALVE